MAIDTKKTETDDIRSGTIDGVSVADVQDSPESPYNELVAQANAGLIQAGKPPMEAVRPFGDVEERDFEAYIDDLVKTNIFQQNIIDVRE